MKGKINVNCTIGREYNTGFLSVSTKAILVNSEQEKLYGKGYANLMVKPKHEISFDTLQLIAAEKDMLSHLEDKGGITFKDCPAEFIYAKAQNEDRYYYAIIVDLGTKDFEVRRTFYLNKMQALYLNKFNPEYEFTKVNTEINDSQDLNEEQI